MNNKSPLRYPGGKTRACKQLESLFLEYFRGCDIKTIVSPFFGGGSFEFYMQNRHGYTIHANDKFTPLVRFWQTCTDNKEMLCTELLHRLGHIGKDEFTQIRKQIMDELQPITQAWMYFVLNRCSFSGATLSGGFSSESSKKRFTISSIERIRNLNLSHFSISNLDFEEFLNQHIEDKHSIVYLDPPYYLEKASKLYGHNGDLHESFDHDKLYACVSQRRNWMMTYNNCDYIRELYKKFNIIDAKWVYGMNKTKNSSEIVILGNLF